MTHAVRRRLFVVVTAALLGGCAAPERADEKPAAATETTIIIVRHAEKADASADPALSGAGRERAARLGVALRDARVRTVFVSDRRRTRETAELAMAGWPSQPNEIKQYPAARPLSELAGLLRAEAPGGVILLVTHSNIIAPLLKDLGGWEQPPLGEADFDWMFIVQLRADGASTLVRAGFPPTP